MTNLLPNIFPFFVSRRNELRTMRCFDQAAYNY